MTEKPPQQPPGTPDAPPETDADRCCANCGYHLAGLSAEGSCPECGCRYAPQLLLKPWPSAGRICWQLGWPTLGVMLGAFFLWRFGSSPHAWRGLWAEPDFVIGVGTLWAMLVAIPVNSYFRVRKLLKDSLPASRRRHGFVAAFRGVGATLCLVLFLLFFVVPIAMIGMCFYGLA